MALDHALALAAVDGGATLRLYSWARPTVSFGRNEPARGLYSERAAEQMGVEYVRRPTGGRAVLHDGEVTYAVVAPARALGGVRRAYRRINQALAAALRSLGAPVDLGASEAVMPVDAGPCFQGAAEGEVVADDRKLVGSAQARIGRVLLQHGSIILHGDQSRLGALCEGAADYPRPSSLAELLGPVRPEDVVEAVTEYMEREFGGSWSSGGYEPNESASADSLKVSQYEDDDWVWRR